MAGKKKARSKPPEAEVKHSLDGAGEKIVELEKKVTELEKENTSLKKDILAKIEEIGNIKKDYQRRQLQSAKRTIHNPWKVIYSSEDGRERTEIIQCGTKGVIVAKILNDDGVNAIIGMEFCEQVRHRTTERSDGMVENAFS